MFDKTNFAGLKDHIAETNALKRQDVWYYSVSKINEDLKQEFDRDGNALKASKNPRNPMFGKPVDEIIKAWEAKGAVTRQRGMWCDEYVGYLLEGQEAKAKMMRLDHPEPEMENKFNCIDEAIDTLVKRAGMELIARETELMGVFRTRLGEIGVQGRFDALFRWKQTNHSGYELVLIDWKNTDNITKENKYGGKLLGPLSGFDECDLNMYSNQLGIYEMILRQSYGVDGPINKYIGQFPAEGGFKLHKPADIIDYETFIKILEYVKQKEELKKTMK